MGNMETMVRARISIGASEAPMGEPIPGVGKSANENLKNPMISGGEIPVGVGGPFRVGNLDKPDLSAREKRTEKNRDRLMTDQEEGKRIHGDGLAEKPLDRFDRIRHPSRALVPKKAEAFPGLQMPQSRSGDVVKGHVHSHATAEPDQQFLTEGLGHGSRRAEQRNSLPGHPCSQVLPVMEVCGEKKAGTGAKAFQLSGVPVPGPYRRAVMAVAEAKEIQKAG